MPAGWAPLTLPAALVLTGAVSVQAGAGIADRMFGEVAPAAVTALRLWAAALILLLVAGRPTARAVTGMIQDRTWSAGVTSGAFGIALGLMNFCIYQAFARLPLGIAVTIEFLGPLGVAVAGARRAASLGWAVLAGCGVLLLANSPGGHLSLAGAGFALASAAGWAGYIVLSRASGQRLPGASGLVIAMCVAAALVTGPGLAAGGRAMFRPGVLAAGAGIGVLSSVIPYGLEFAALRRVPARLFGVWMSMQPAVAAVVGLLLLGQRLRLPEWAGICCVVIASAGAARGGVPGQVGDTPQAVDAGKLMRSSNTMRRVSSVLVRLCAPVLRPTQLAVRRWALAAVISNAVLTATGAAVRLSSSGLGCPDWPTCTKSSLVAAHAAGQTTLNTWIEFGNRLLTYPGVAIAGLTFIACVMYKPGGRRRKDLVWLSAILPLGVVAQAVVGGIVVLSKLNPALVSAHFLLSAVIIVSAAVVLHVRTSEGAGPVRPLVRVDLRVLSGVLVLAAGAVIAAGTVVTGTGPLAGTTIDSHGHLTTVPRYHLSLEGVTQFHADLAWFISAIAVALVIGLRFAPGTPRRSVIYSRVVLGWIVVQAVIGYVQYFNHLPAGLVWVHVASAVGLWISVLRLYLSTRERLPLPATGDSEEEPAVPAATA